MDDNNWDLFAVVRGCSATGVPPTDPFSGFRSPLPSLSSPLDGAKSELFGFPESMVASTSFRHVQQLEEVLKPFYMELEPQPAPGLLPQQVQQQQQKVRPLLSPKSSYSTTACTATSLFPNIAGVSRHLQEQTRLQPQRPNSSNPRNSKRRKNQLKKVVCHMPADGASSDLWAWRKYGQKPIKGSPYPRGYYRCSSSKGCQARKQVERSRADPAILIITYTAEHNHPVPTHRNSLAGSTRQKFPPASSASAQPHTSSPSASGRTVSSAYPSSNSLSSPPSAVRLSPTSPLAESMQNDLPLQTQQSLMTNMTEVHEGNEEDAGGEDAEEAGHIDDDDEEELLTVGDVEMMGEEDMVFLGMEVLRGPAVDAGSMKLPATVSAISDFFNQDEGGVDDHFFRSSWLPNNNAAAAASGR